MFFISCSKDFFHTSKLLKGFLSSGASCHFECVEFDGFGEGAAFTNSGDITDRHVPEARRQVHGDILVSLFETVVFLDVVQVISTDNGRLVHLQFGDNSGQDATTDGHLSDEGTLLVDVVTFAGLKYTKHRSVPYFK